MLSKLKIECRNKDKGCTKVLDYDKFETHEENECEFDTKPCPNHADGCREKPGRLRASRSTQGYGTTQALHGGRQDLDSGFRKAILKTSV